MGRIGLGSWDILLDLDGRAAVFRLLASWSLFFQGPKCDTTPTILRILDLEELCDCRTHIHQPIMVDLAPIQWTLIMSELSRCSNSAGLR
jgi:hypothetical protein